MPIKDNYSAATSKFFAVLPLRNSAGHKSFLPFLKIQAAAPALMQRPPLLFKDFVECQEERLVLILVPKKLGFENQRLLQEMHDLGNFLDFFLSVLYDDKNTKTF